MMKPDYNEFHMMPTKKGRRKITLFRQAARVIYSEAIRKKIIRRRPCELCKTVLKIHGHHADYSQPLKVKWLCQKHHYAHHKMIHGRQMDQWRRAMHKKTKAWMQRDIIAWCNAYNELATINWEMA